MLHKLSSETIKTYECQLVNIREPQSLKEFLQFIENRFMAISSAENKSETTEISKHETGSAKKGTHTAKCLYCNKEHYTYKCETFLKLEPTKRFEWAKAEKLCFNCLYKHKINDCKSKKTCNECSKKHHTVLHFIKNPEGEGKQKISLCATTESDVEEETDEPASSSQTFAHVAAKCTSAILPTALVCVSAINGEKKLLRVLLDQGSQSTFITENAVQLLGLKKQKLSSKIFGIGATPKVANSVVDISVSSRFSEEFVINSNAIVLNTLTNFNKLMKNNGNNQQFQHLENLVLADPSAHANHPIDLLLGTVEYAKAIQPGLVKGNSDEPIAQNTIFG